jgi:hypothetical protein
MTLLRTAVNNALLDPLQGFDIDVYVQDQGSGAQVMVGSFTSFQHTMRNATEPYMEFNQRVPRLLDGECQFGWVMEQGLIDTRIMENTFGFNYIGRELRMSRFPRFQITIVHYAPELESGTAGNDIQAVTPFNSVVVGSGVVTSRQNRKATGQTRLLFAKTDSLTVGYMAGRSVVGCRWEGLCEGMVHVPFETNANYNGGAALQATSSPSYATSKSFINDFTVTNLAPDWSNFITK